MPGVADQHDRVAVLGVAAGLRVHLCDERTGGVDRREPPGGGRLVHRRRHAVSRQDELRSLGRLGHAFDEDGPARLQVADDMGVVDDLLADVHRRAVQLQRLLDRVHGPLDAGAVPARRREEDALDQTGGKDRRGPVSFGLRARIGMKSVPPGRARCDDRLNRPRVSTSRPEWLGPVSSKSRTSVRPARNVIHGDVVACATRGRRSFHVTPWLVEYATRTMSMPAFKPAHAIAT